MRVDASKVLTDISDIVEYDIFVPSCQDALPGAILARHIAILLLYLQDKSGL